MKRRRFLAAGAGSLAALAGCFGSSQRELPETPSGEWYQYARDEGNTGSSDVSVAPRGNPAWNAGVAQTASPLFADGTVYSVADEVTALDGQTGEEVWRSELPGEARKTPVLDDDQVIVATEEALLGLAREDGGELWSRDLTRPIHRAPTLVDDPPRLLVPQAEFGLAAFDPDDGEELWSDRTIAPRTPAVVKDSVVFSGYMQDGDTGVLRGIAADDGEREWSVEIDHPDAPPVAAAEGLVLADGGTLALHDPENGDRVDDLGSFGDRIPATPAVAGGTAFVATYDAELVAISLADGTVEWRVDAGPIGDAAIAVGDDAVVASVESLPETSAAGVVAVERESGAIRWEHAIEGFDAFPSTPPVLADGAIYYASNASSGVVALGDLSPRDSD